MTATSFQTNFGTAIQGMKIEWSQTQASAGTYATTDTLHMDFTLNMFNMLDLATGTGEAADVAASLTPIL